MTTVTKPVLLAAAAFAAFVLAYPTAREHVPGVHLLGSRTPAAAQSASQLSGEEYALSGYSPARLRAFAGEPATRTEAAVEGVRLECWYYGVAGARGAYQICFENGRLSTKSRFG